MSVWTQSLKWAKYSGVVRLPKFKIVLALPILILVSIVALAQKPTPTPTIPPPVSPGMNIPEFRTIPTPGQIALPTSQKPGTDTCLLPPLDLASSPMIAAGISGAPHSTVVARKCRALYFLPGRPSRRSPQLWAVPAFLGGSERSSQRAGGKR
jgi:hypothetical protein